MELSKRIGAHDDQLNPPTVTPDPAPADDQLVRLAALGTAAGAVALVFVLRWLKRNIVVSRRVL